MDPPNYLIKIFPLSARSLFEFRRQLASQVDDIIANPDILRSSNQQETVCHHLIGHDDLDLGPKHGKLTREELLHKVFTLLGAGSDTVGHACNVGFFHVLKDETIYRRLLDEIDHAWSDKDFDIPTSTLEKLPYLVTIMLLYPSIGHTTHDFYNRQP
jgi:cytochrome P450